MKKFIFGFLLGIVVTLYFLMSLDTGPVNYQTSSNFRNPLKPYQEQQKDIQPISNKTDIRYQAIKSSGSQSNIEKKAYPRLALLKKDNNLPYYHLKLSGPKAAKVGNVLIGENKGVWCDLKTLLNCMGWKITKDGSVYSSSDSKSRIFRLTDHLTENDNLFVSLSDLKKLWILDFSIDPLTHTLIIK